MSATQTLDTLARISALLSAHPDVETPYISIYDHTPHKADLRWYLHINGKGDAETQRKKALSIVREIGGKWDKRFNANDVDFEQKRDGLSLQVSVVREAVCVRRVVGTETVIIPAVAEATVEREIVEWDCAPVLAGEST